LKGFTSTAAYLMPERLRVGIATPVTLFFLGGRNGCGMGVAMKLPVVFLLIRNG
jgi:hypothetical protein